MNDIINCLFSKTPQSPKIVYNSTEIRDNPQAPCWKFGEPELVYAYIGMALAIPFLLTIYSQRYDLFRAIGNLCHRGRSIEARDDKISDDDDDEQRSSVQRSADLLSTTQDTNVLGRVRELAARKAQRSLVRNTITLAASSQSGLGQFVMLGTVFCSLVSVAVYLKRTLKKPVSLELCGVDMDFWSVADILANVYLATYFVLQFYSSQYTESHKRLKVVYSLRSFGDYFNVSTVVLTSILSRRFTGFGFFRVYNLILLVDVAASRSLLHSAVKIRVLRLIILVISVIAIAAGFLHLAENLGDPFLADDEDGNAIYNGQLVAYWRVLLYVYGRLTLLDLSGIRLYTHCGRITIFAFQLIAVGVIGKAIPAIFAHIRVTPDYDKAFHKPSSYLHIVVCGCVTTPAMKSFLREFYHKDRIFAEHFKVVILSEKTPDEEMESLTERYFNKMEYKKGSMMNLKDLRRIRLTEAAATLILADRLAGDADADDAANIMRVVSVKNLQGSARVIVQVSQHHSKAYLQNIPSWSPSGDTIICIAELRLGLLAQSCHAPGFSTMVANLFTTRSFDDSDKFKEHWMADYTRGAAQELYYRPFSQAFYGMNFVQACRLCYSELHIVLLAIQDDPERYEGATPKVNAPTDMLIEEGTLGYFLADKREEVQRISWYCQDCHRDVKQPEDIHKCNCPFYSNVNMETADGGKDDGRILRSSTNHTDTDDQALRKVRSVTSQSNIDVESQIWLNICGAKTTAIPGMIDGEETAETVPAHDSTGMFYWIPDQPLQEIIMTRTKMACRAFSCHIVICVLSQKDSKSMGLANFVFPLRSTSIPLAELVDIVVLCDDGILEKEWSLLKNMPRLFLLKGSALNRADLRAVHLATCKMCVMIGAPGQSGQEGDSTLMDKSVILATLNVRAMRFSPHESQQQKGTSVLENDIPRRQHGYQVPMITDLMRDTNAEFLDDDDDDQLGTEFYLTQPFSGGRAFAASTLDLLMITSFFNPAINRVIQSIIFGEVSSELEQILAEGAGLIGGAIPISSQRQRNQIRVVQFELSTKQFSEEQALSYGGFFLNLLTNSGILLLGLSRQIQGKPEKRFVVCSPPEFFQLQLTDQLIGLQRVGQ